MNLRKITQLKFAIDSREIQDLTAQESRLRTRMAKILTQEDDASAGFEIDPTLRLGQADLLWKIWVGRQKTAINTELARVLYQKEKTLAQARQAFGKQEVVKMLIKKSK